MPGVQRWKDYSSNPDRGGYIIGHNWSILVLLSPFSGRWLCFPIIANSKADSGAENVLAVPIRSERITSG